MEMKDSVLEDSAVAEKPQNGIAGLKHWRSDMLAGLMVSLVSLPFSLGIAISSGAPPVAGLISAIIAGLIYPFLGGSFVTISGPAAGLAPVLFVAMAALGGAGEPYTGYPRLLAVICMAGCVQIVLSRLKVARYSAWFSPTVVEAMLASIGLLIIAKELPDLIGNRFEAHEFWPILAELPSQIMQMNPSVFIVGCLCLAITIALSVARNRWTKIIPPPLTVVLIGLGLGMVFGIDGKHLIEIPDKLKDGMKLPDFHSLFANHTLWWTAFTAVLTLTLIDGVESLATIAGIDKIDPYKRKSSPDRTLLAMGISNILSSVAGGLTIIPGGVKSTTCIVTGGKTLWANFYNAIFLLLYLFLGRGFINMIPRAALAAIVVFIGYKLCQPKVWRHVAHVGSEQLLVFCSTVLVTVSTDLLLGIISGMVLEFVLNVSFAWPTVRVPGVALATPAPSRMGNGALGLVSRFTDLFRNPVSNRELVNDQYHLYFSRPLVSFNLLHLNRELTRIPQQATVVYFHVGDQVTLIDHTSSSNLMGFARDYEQNGKGQIHFTGLEEMLMLSKDETCVRLGALSTTGAVRGGIGALIAKARYSLLRGRPAVAATAGNVVAPTTPRFAANGPADLAFFSLSARDSAEGQDLSILGPVPHSDASSELARLSLSWDGSEPVAEHT